MRHRFARIARCNRDSNHNLARLEFTQGMHRRLHTRSGCEAIIHQDNRLARWVLRRSVVAIEMLAAFQLGRLKRNDRVQFAARDAIDDARIENRDASRCNCSHGEFLMTGNAELANYEDIEWRAERTRDFVCDGNTAAWQAENEHVCITLVGRQPVCERAPCLRAVAESVLGDHGLIIPAASHYDHIWQSNRTPDGTVLFSVSECDQSRLRSPPRRARMRG